jgi:hypothetical protein
LNEPSTYRGLALLLTAFGVVLDPATLSAVGGGVVALIGLYDTIRKE